MAGINFTDINGCLGANEEVLYTNAVNITSQPWDTGGFIQMGNRANADATPTSWSPTNTALKTSGYWDGLFPWIVIYSGDNVAHTGTNTRVEVSNFRCLVYSKIQNAWVDLTSNDTRLPTSEINFNYILGTATGTADKRVEANGNISYKLDSSRRPIKAYLDPKRIYGSDVGGIMISCDAKLILDNIAGVDDITANTTRLLISCGADLRPTTTTAEADFTPAKSPVVMGSRYRLVSGTNKTFFAVPINPPVPDSLNITSVYYGTGARQYFSYEWFERNYPKVFFNRTPLNDAELYAPLTNSLLLARGTGSYTFTRATEASLFNENNKLITVPSNCARFAGARFVRNLLSRSEGFDQTGWTKTNVTPTPGYADHLGGTKARLMTVGTSIANTCTTTSAGAFAVQTGAEYCFSFYIKSGNWDQFCINCQITGKDVKQWFSLSGGIAATTSSGGWTNLGASLTSVGNGWYRIQLSIRGDIVAGQANIQSVIRAVSTVTSPLNYGTVGGATYYVAFAQGEWIERKANKVASEYVSNGEDASPYHGAGVDGSKYFTTKEDGLPILEDVMLGYQYQAANRTNDVLWCKDFTNAAWVKTTMNAFLDQVGIAGIAGQASSLTATAAAAKVLQPFTKAAAARTFSVYIKRLTGTGAIAITRDGGTNWTTITGLINSSTFTKVSIEAHSVLNPSVGIRISTSGDSIAVDYAQDEDGTTASEPIYTTTVAVTRNAEVLTYPNTNFNDTEGSILATVTKPNWSKNNGTVVGSATTGMLTAGSVNGVVGQDGINTANPPSQNYSGTGGGSTPSVNIAVGHYWAAYSTSLIISSGISPSAWTSIKNEIRDNVGLLGVQLRWCWADLENAAGTAYDFSSIQGRLDELAAISGKVGRLCMMFEHKGDIPTYLKNSTYDGGLWDYNGGIGATPEGTNLCYWNVPLRNRLALLANALGTYLNNQANFETFTTQESSFASAPLGTTGANYSETGYIDGLLQFTLAMKAAMPDKVVRMSLNFPGSQVARILPTVLASKLSLSFPNVMPDHSGFESHQAGLGGVGIYPVARTNKNIIGVWPEVQRPDYMYTNLTWKPQYTNGWKETEPNMGVPPSGGHKPTIPEKFDYIKTNFNPRGIIWTRAVDVSQLNGIQHYQDVLNYINLPVNDVPGWGLDTSLPSIYQTSTAEGTLKMALTWNEGKMHLNVQGSPVGSDATYKGSFDLANVGIGVAGAGFVKKVYIWKNVLSDDEKRQVTSKRGINTHF